MEEIEHKHLYKAKLSFPVDKCHKKEGDRRILIEKDEIVEFRFFSPANFRTHDDIYCSMPEDEFKNNFIHYGEIWKDVSWNNRTKLDVILEHKLYDKAKG